MLNCMTQSGETQPSSRMSLGRLVFLEARNIDRN